MKYLFVILLILTTFLYAIDAGLLNSRLTNRLFYKADCDFVIPKGYGMLYNNESHTYIISDSTDRYSDVTYLTTNDGIQSFHYSIKPPTTFKDSCRAKGYLKAYLNNPTDGYK